MNEQRPTILLVEDDRHTRTFLADNLAADGFEPVGAVNAREALRLMESRYPDLAILDLTLPDRDGLELLQQVREADRVASRVDPLLPVLVLTGRVGELNRLRGFDKGADDYLGKPFSYPELRARVRALLRRGERAVRHGVLRVGGLEVDPAARSVRLNGRPLAVSQKEFALLRTLASDPTRVFSKEELLRSLWGFRTNGSTRTLDSHACRLRQKLARDGDRYLVNVWGVGYRLADGPALLEEPAPLGGELAPGVGVDARAGAEARR
jgi:DNA-binding response OmpR family regulator